MGGGHTGKLQTMLRAAVAGLTLAVVAATAAPASDTLMPSGFFQRSPEIGTQPVSVTADFLTYDADHHLVTAQGNVEVDYDGTSMKGDRLIFDQTAHTAHFIGNVVMQTPEGEVYTGTDVQLSGPLHDALVQQLTLTTKDGALITAPSGDFRRGDDTKLENATYAPCGRCIDSKGRRIGWSAKSAHMIYHNQSSTVTLEQPSLYLLGIPVAWLPWLTIPDPTKRISTFRMPSFDYSSEFGARLNLPYFIAADRDDDVILTPSLMSRQGLLVAGEWDHRFPNGSIQVKASGIRQLDPSAYSGTVGDVEWRGAAQTSGQFVPLATWTVGWSYTAFTDAAFLTDYHYVIDDKTSVSQAYATHLQGNEFFDFRVQQFNKLGDVTTVAQDQQARALPNARYRNVLYLPRDMGELDLSADLLSVQRGADQDQGSPNGVHYVTGYEEWKVHGTVEADWQKRWIVPGGVAVTPYLGLRADAAYYDSTSAYKAGTIELFNATPIAAVDVRYPWVARAEGVTQVIEPITQLVYRGSDVTNLGISNDNAQSFVFDDSNLFSYNRFSGTDRQETGLRANVGAHYQANFDNGGWIDLLGGQSFQLAGTNAFATADPTEVTAGQGLSSSASYVVLGAKGSPWNNLTFASKFQIDPSTPTLTRAGAGATYNIAGYNFSLDYLYLAAIPDRGVLSQQQEVSAGVSVPFWDYWRANAHAGWDITSNTWLAAGVGVVYDDHYLRYGATVEATGPTNVNGSDLRVTGSFFLKGLGGSAF
ncbi:MAG: LPS assembly protein LptD [Devosia sp.]|nr:LPS assembly protein LptD [Devosia sp.]